MPELQDRSDLRERMRMLIDTAEPVTLEEIWDRSSVAVPSDALPSDALPSDALPSDALPSTATAPVAAPIPSGAPVLSRPVPRRRREQWALAGAAAAVVAAVVGIGVAHADGSHHVPIIPSSSAPAAIIAPAGTGTPAVPPPAPPAEVNLTTPPLPGCSLQQAGGPWRCWASVAEASEVVGAPVADPTVPTGYQLADRPAVYVGPGPLAAAYYERLWTPGGASSPDGPYLELRVMKAHHRRGQGGRIAGRATLANGATAQGNLSPTAAATGLEVLDWSHDGLDYELQASGQPSSVVLAVANSLP